MGFGGHLRDYLVLTSYNSEFNRDVWIIAEAKTAYQERIYFQEGCGTELQGIFKHDSSKHWHFIHVICLARTQGPLVARVRGLPVTVERPGTFQPSSLQAEIFLKVLCSPSGSLWDSTFCPSLSPRPLLTSFQNYSY